VPDLKLAVRLADLHLPFREALLTAARLGASAVEIDVRRDLEPAELSDTGLRQVRKMLDDLNLRVCSVRFPTRRGYHVLEELDRRVQATIRAMRLAFRLGARIVTNQIGRIPESHDDPDWSTLQSVMEDLGRAGAREGAILAAETGTESGSRLAELLQSLQNGYVGVALNPGKLIVHEHSVTDALASLGSLVEIVIAQDGVRDLAERRGIQVPLGNGSADFPELLALLEDKHYRGYFVVVGEHTEDPREEVRQAIQYLRQL
jgi:sugar phosphate isomerase/epimerase